MEALIGFFSTLFVTVSSVFSPMPTPTPTPTPPIVEMYQAKGETERYPYRVRYILWIPKGGGETNGEIRGYMLNSEQETCSASFHGFYEGVTLSGDISGVCTILFLDQKIIGTFEGTVNAAKQYVDGWVNGNIGSVAFSEYIYIALQ